MARLDRIQIAGAIGYIALLILSFVPQSLRPADTVGYIGDSLDSVYTIARNATVMVSDPAQLFNANILYPHRESLALFGHKILLGLLAIPVLWATQNPILSYNWIVALGCLLAAYSAQRLALALGIGSLGAWAAGAVYAFNTYQVNEAPRPDLLFHGLTTFALLCLLRFLANGRALWAWGAALLLLAQGYASNYLILYGSVLLSLVAAAHLVARPARTLGLLPKAILPAVVATLLFLPVLQASLRAAQTYGLAREPPIGMDLGRYLWSGTNLLYGPIGLPTGLQSRAPHFIGFLSLALALLSLSALPAKSVPPAGGLVATHVWVAVAGALALFFILMSLGIEIVVQGHVVGPGPYRLFHEWIPGFRFIRHPERLALFAMLFISLLAGRGIDRVRARGRPLAVVCAVLLPLEHVGPLPTTQRLPVADRIPEVYTWLAEQPIRAAAELPGNGESLVRKETLEEYFSLYHRKPIIHGYVSYAPPLTVVLRRAAEQFPSETSLEIFRRVGVDTLLLHQGRDRAVDMAAWSVAAPNEADVVRVFDRPWVIPAPEIWSPSTVGRPTATPIFTASTTVYRLRPRATRSPAPLPGGHRVLGAGWRYEASSGNPLLASDERADTLWTTVGDDQDGAYEIEFPQPLQVTGVRIPVDWKTTWPTQFRVEGRAAGGTSWDRLGLLDAEHVLQLVEQLLVSPGQGTIGFDLGGSWLSGVRLRASSASVSKAWAVREIEVWASQQR